MFEFSETAEDMHAMSADFEEAQERQQALNDWRESRALNEDEEDDDLTRDDLTEDDFLRMEMEDRHLDSFWEEQHEVEPEFFGGE